MGKKLMKWVLLLLCLLFLPHGNGYAAEQENAIEINEEEKQQLEESVADEMKETEQILQQFDFDDINQELESMFPQYDLDFSELFQNIMSGDLKLSFNLIVNMLKESIFGEVGEIKKIFVTIIMIGIISALFSNFSKIFENHQIADIGFYFMYMLLIVILIKTFEIGVSIAAATTNYIILFMKLLIPTFFTAVGLASGSLTALAFHQLTLFVIFAVETILLSLLLPFTNTYIFLVVINGLNEEERFTALLEMLRKGINLILKLVLGLVGGIGFLQSMITPVIDGLKMTTIRKTISVIPGLGNIADSITEVVLGSAVLIKNSIGVALMVILVIVCLVPIIKIALLTLVLKGSAAIMGIITDKRMTACTNQVGDGSLLLLKIAITALSLFLITIAIVITATRRGV